MQQLLLTLVWLSLSAAGRFQQLLHFCFSIPSSVICSRFCLFTPQLMSPRWRPCRPPRLSHQECLFCRMHETSGDIGVTRVSSTVDTFPVRIGVCSHSDRFLLLANVHNFTADDVQRFDDGCQKNKQIRLQSFISTSCFLCQFSSTSPHLTSNKPAIWFANHRTADSHIFLGSVSWNKILGNKIFI